MLRNAKEIKGRALRASDGIIGEVKDVYFDDHHWHVRYLVVATGAWLDRRSVLIAPEAVGPLDWKQQVLPVNLTMDQVRHSPGLETDKPVSRQYEETLRQHYGWPMYWDPIFGSAGIVAPIPGPTPAGDAAGSARNDGNVADRPRGDPFLRSVNDTTGYHLEALDGSLGHVDDFLLHLKAWRVRYLIVDTRNWWPGKKVLVAPGWIKDVSWTSKTVTVDLTRDAIKSSPPYDPARPWSPVYAAELHDYYQRPRYSDWDEEFAAGAPPLERGRPRDSTPGRPAGFP